MKITYDWLFGPWPDYAVVELINEEFSNWPSLELEGVSSEDKYYKYYHAFFEHIRATYNIAGDYSSESGILTLTIPDHIHTLLELQYS